MTEEDARREANRLHQCIAAVLSGSDQEKVAEFLLETWRAGYRHSASLRREIETPLPSYGAVQGILHSWFKEVREPYFQLRELSTDAFVKVFYAAPLYADVARAVQERSTVLIVTGDMLFDRAARSATELRADRIERVGMLSSAEFENFFGSAPEFVPDDVALNG